MQTCVDVNQLTAGRSPHKVSLARDTPLRNVWHSLCTLSRYFFRAIFYTVLSMHLPCVLASSPAAPSAVGTVLIPCPRPCKSLLDCVDVYPALRPSSVSSSIARWSPRSHSRGASPPRWSKKVSKWCGVEQCARRCTSIHSYVLSRLPRWPPPPSTAPPALQPAAAAPASCSTKRWVPRAARQAERPGQTARRTFGQDRGEAGVARHVARAARQMARRAWGVACAWHCSQAQVQSHRRGRRSGGSKWRRWRSRRRIRLVGPSLALPAGPPTLPKGNQWVSLQAPSLLPRCLTRSSAPGSCSTKQWVPPEGWVARQAQRPNESALQIFGQDRRAAVMVRWVAR